VGTPTEGGAVGCVHTCFPDGSVSWHAVAELKRRFGLRTAKLTVMIFYNHLGGADHVRSWALADLPGRVCRLDFRLRRRRGPDPRVHPVGLCILGMFIGC